MIPREFVEKLDDLVKEIPARAFRRVLKCLDRGWTAYTSLVRQIFKEK